MSSARAEDDLTSVPPVARPRKRWPLRIALAAAMIVVGLNLWTGAPLLAVWVGAEVQQDQAGLTMGTVFVVIAVMATTMFLLFRALRWLDIRYGEVIGRKAGTRQPVPWLKSASGERVPRKRPPEPLTAFERVMVAVVVLAIGSFEVWFFFFAGSSLPRQ